MCLEMVERSVPLSIELTVRPAGYQPFVGVLQAARDRAANLRRIDALSLDPRSTAAGTWCAICRRAGFAAARAIAAWMTFYGYGCPYSALGGPTLAEFYGRSGRREHPNHGAKNGHGRYRPLGLDIRFQPPVL